MQTAAMQLMRAIRGSRSQVAFSRRLGYRSNTAADWEAGRRFVTGAEMLRACWLVKIDVLGALNAFAPALAHHLSQCASGPEPISARLLAAWLDGLRGDLSILEVAKRCDHSRFAVGRWLSGKAQPRLPDFLIYIEAVTGRVVDLIDKLVRIDHIPALADERAAREALRDLAFRAPWTEAILRVLELDAYQNVCGSTVPWIAKQLNLTPEQVTHNLRQLERARLVRFDGNRFVIERTLTVDTHASAERFRHLQQHWMQVAQTLSEGSQPGAFHYNVFSCSAADFERIRQLQRSFFQQARTIIAASQPIEKVGLMQNNLYAWSPEKEIGERIS